MAATAMAHCNACDLELEPDADRCPKCLRKSTVRSHDSDHDDEDGASWIGPRAVVALTAIVLGGLATWRIVESEKWLEAHGVWLAAILVALGLVTMPLRVAFRMDSKATSTKDAFRFYALSTLAVDGLIVLFAACVGIAALVLGESAVALPVGLFAFFMLIVAAPVVVVAVKRPHELRATLRRSGKMALVLTGIVIGGTALVYARVATAPETKTLVIPANAKDLLDPMDLESVTVERLATRDAGGTTTRHLRADGGNIKRTLLKLDVVALSAIDETKGDPSASGVVRCWVPERLRTADAEAELAKEQATMDQALTNVAAKTPSGRVVRVVFAFGRPPT
jgi:hypothetical protein